MPDSYLYKKENKKLLGIGSGETIYVRTLQNADVHQYNYQGWFIDQQVCKYNGHGKFSHAENYKVIDWGNRDMILWAVCLERKTMHKHIGNVSLKINWHNRSAEFGCIFGDKREWRKGYATQSLSWLIDHGFQKLNLNRIWLGTPVENIAMSRAAEKVGMSKEGVLHSEIWLNGKYEDVVRYGIVREA